MRCRRACRLIGILGCVIAIVAVVQFALFAVFLARTMILRPFWDRISWIDAYLQVHRYGDVPGYLWTPHNEHHLPLIRLLTTVDVSAFHANGVSFVIAATTALVAAALLVFRELRRGNNVPLSLAWLGPMLLLTSVAAVDCSIPINSVYPLALVFIVASLVLFNGEAERTPYTTTRRIAALLTAMLASTANAVGLVAWPALLWSAWRGGAAPRWQVLIAAVGAGYGVMYLHGLPSIGHGDPAAFFAFAHLWKMLDYLLAYLGLPLSRAPGLGLPARVLGGVLLAAGGIAVLRDVVAPRPATRLHRFVVGLVIVALVAAFLAAIGRVDLEAEVKVPVRYALLVAPLHIGLLALALPFLTTRAVTYARRVALLGGASVFAAGLLVLQIMAGRAAVTASDAIATTLDRYDDGLREPGMERVVFPDLAEADRILTALRYLRR